MWDYITSFKILLKMWLLLSLSFEKNCGYFHKVVSLIKRTTKQLFLSNIKNFFHMFYYSWKKDRKSIYLFQSFSIEKMHTYSSTYQLPNYELFIFTKTTIYRESKAVKIVDFLGRKLYTDMSKNSSSTYVAAFFTENFRHFFQQQKKIISHELLKK